MTITFEPLTTNHFPLLLKWLEVPHVKAWWNDHVIWTLELIEKKYRSYIAGSNLIHAYIIHINNKPIGYIQYYNKHDFPREHDYAIELPSSCAAIDWYIGEPDFVGRGIGTRTLELFLKSLVFTNFDNVFVDPDTPNVAAIRAYEKAGFKRINQAHSEKITLMIKENEECLSIKAFQ